MQARKMWQTADHICRGPMSSSSHWHLTFFVERSIKVTRLGLKCHNIHRSQNAALDIGLFPEEYATQLWQAKRAVFTSSAAHQFTIQSKDRHCPCLVAHASSLQEHRSQPHAESSMEKGKKLSTCQGSDAIPRDIQMLQHLEALNAFRNHRDLIACHVQGFELRQPKNCSWYGREGIVLDLQDA